VARIVAILDGPCLGCDLDNGQHRFSCARYGKNAPRLPAVMAPEPNTRPMLGPSKSDGHDGSERRCNGMLAAWAFGDGTWTVYPNDHAEPFTGNAGDLAGAEIQRDRVARAFYRLPEDAKEPK
jgi:hypothetical protein